MSENKDFWHKKKKEMKTLQTVTKLTESWLATAFFSPDTQVTRLFRTILMIENSFNIASRYNFPKGTEWYRMNGTVKK